MALAILTETVSFFNGWEMIVIEMGEQVTIDLHLSAAKSPCGSWFEICPTEYQVFN